MSNVILANDLVWLDDTIWLTGRKSRWEHIQAEEIVTRK